MKKTSILISISLVIIAFLSCKQGSGQKHAQEEDKVIETKINEEELKYVVNDFFPVGDVRRYGIKVDGGNPIHPYTKKPTLESLIKLASKEKIELFFPEGFYDFGLYFNGDEYINMAFDNAEFSGPIFILEDESNKQSSHIKLKGTLSTYYKLFIRNSEEIEIENIKILSDINKNSSKLRSMGCDIYAGSKNIYISSLYIEDLGSGNPNFENSRAALQVHGWNNNPVGLLIDKVHIKSSDRHGVYLTGSDHNIGSIIIDEYGVGSMEDVNDLEDTDVDKDETSNLTGLWLNKCDNSTISYVQINTKNSKGKYSVWLDSGDIGKPTIIEALNLVGGDSKLPIYAEDITNVVIKSVEKQK